MRVDIVDAVERESQCDLIGRDHDRPGGSLLIKELKFAAKLYGAIFAGFVVILVLSLASDGVWRRFHEWDCRLDQPIWC